MPDAIAIDSSRRQQNGDRLEFRARSAVRCWHDGAQRNSASHYHRFAGSGEEAKPKLGKGVAVTDYFLFCCLSA
jgi:hypothetical protein